MVIVYLVVLPAWSCSFALFPSMLVVVVFIVGVWGGGSVVVWAVSIGTCW